MSAAHRPLLAVGGLSLPASALAQALRAAGYGVPSALDEGDDVLAELESRPYELVVMDEVMGDGHGAARLAQSIRDDTGIPVVFVGHGEDRERFVRLREVDPFGFLFLPLTAPSVRIVVDLALHRLDLERERHHAAPGRQVAHERLKRADPLLPLCASCKKVSSQEGRWWRLEEYFARHAGLQFTHGLCPDCSQRLYGRGATGHVAQAGKDVGTRACALVAPQPQAKATAGERRGGKPSRTQPAVAKKSAAKRVGTKKPAR